MECRRLESRSVIVRPMTHADIPGGLRLCRASNWNQLADDWRVFLDRGAGFVAVEDDTLMGSVACLPFGADFTWLSMMLVDPAARRSGIGSRLMEAALDSLPSDCCVRLDATPAGEPLYRRYGFAAEYELARTTATTEGPPPSPEVRPIAPDDLPAIFATDHDVFGANRAPLLADFYRRAPDLAWITEGAYCFGRPGFRHPQIGPVVAGSVDSARALVAQCLATHDGQSFVVDIPRRPDGLSFHVERPFLRMCRGSRRHREVPTSIFAIAGPEFG
jgi:GNAT superfamily N-acetyltransferase